MSVAGRSIGDTGPTTRAYQPVAIVNPTTGAVVPVTADGSQPVSGGNGTSAASTANPVPVAGSTTASGVQFTSAKPNNTAYLASTGANTNNQLLAGAPVDVFQITGFNTQATPLFVRLYNKATGPVMASDTPKLIQVIPQGGFAIDWPAGVLFNLGLGMAITKGSAAIDTTATAAGDLVGFQVVFGVR